VSPERRTQPLLELVLERTRREGGCLVYTRARSSAGYGQIWDGTTKRVLYAHRVVAEALCPRPDPGHNEVLHACDNPPCVEPSHLSWGTHAQNLRDMFARGRRPHPGTAKLRAADIPAIRARLAAGDPYRAIAADFGVTEAAIGHIARGTTWRTA
jgi:hypothetical protein